MSQNLAQRSVRSVTWNILESGITTGLNLVQFVVLARLLPVETFGIYTSAYATVILVFSIAQFGLGSAFLYRTPETEDIERASATMFTLKLILTTLFGILLLLGIFLFADPQQSDLRLALLVITVTTALNQQAHTAQSILVRRVQHGRLAILAAVDEAVATTMGIVLALSGVTLWALLIRNVVTPIVNLIGLYVWRPVWRPRLSWDPAGMRYFLSYGFRTLITQWLYNALDNLDDIWTGVFLGSEPLGFYSRAYRLARMPSILITGPVSSVADGTYAELKGQRKTLSSAFILTNLTMVRSGFFLSGVIALIAPEVVALLLGEKWLPMVGAFQLMLIYALFEPMKRTISNLFLSVGVPMLLMRIQIAQLVTLGIGLFALGLPFGIIGVALAVDIMLVVGIALMLWYARRYVDYSLTALLAMPLLAVLSAIASSYGVLQVLAVDQFLLGIIIKVGLFTLVYAGLLLVLDRPQLRILWQVVRHYGLFGRGQAKDGS